MAIARSSELLAKLELEDLNIILRERMLRWFGHVELSSGTVRAVCDIEVDGRPETQVDREETDREEFL